jgi:hypothetical protein
MTHLKFQLISILMDLLDFFLVTLKADADMHWPARVTPSSLYDLL